MSDHCNGERRRGPRVAIVLPGGGARGAYEVGALSVLLPLLEARGERPVILCGTSVGAINATALGAVADRPADEAVEVLLAQWRGMRKGDVIKPLVGPGLGWTALRMLGEALEVPGVRLAGLLDPAPLRRSLDRWVDWDALHRNVRTGVIESACVVATSLARSGPVAFVDSVRRVPASRPADPLQYVPAVLDGEHVRASAAIPVLFPPVEIEHPAPMAGHYVDGGTRLNAPVAPALALGADRVVVIGFQPFRARLDPGVGGRRRAAPGRRRGEHPRRVAGGPGRRRPPPPGDDQLVHRGRAGPGRGARPTRTARRAGASPTRRSPTRWSRPSAAASWRRSPTRSSTGATPG